VATSITLTGTGPAGLVFGIRATVTGPGPCAGNVTFSEAGRVLYSGSLQPGAVNVDFQVSPNPQVADGPHTFSAAFSTNSPACGPGVSAPFPVYTGVLSSTTEIVSVTPNPSLFGQLPAALVRVHAASGVATGRVAIWYRGGIKPSILAQGDLDASGTIHLTLPSQPMGSWPVTAEYSGSATVKPSVSATFTVVVQPAITLVSAASGKRSIAPGSLATAYGMGLASVSIRASSLPLPTDLGGVQLLIPDSAGAMQKAQLLFVSPNQVNFLVPPNAKTGAVTVELSSAGQIFSAQAVVDNVAPAVFTADGSGSGAPLGVLVTVHGDGSQGTQAVYECSATECRPAELDLGTVTDTNILVLYATGFRNSRLEDVTAQVDSAGVPVLYAGLQADFAGLDQVNIQLPPSSAGRGEVAVQIVAGDKQANVVNIRLR
jgi:uncharacterized protein (TIGR03437 family)